ncbi:MAG: nitroreductase family protein [Chloroflexota bacterium]
MEAFQAITARQGVLRYRPTPVEPARIDHVLRAAVAAPSTANSQPWAFVVVTEPEWTRRLADYLLRTQREHVLRGLLEAPEPFIDHLMGLYDGLIDAPCFIVFCRRQRVALAPAPEREQAPAPERGQASPQYAAVVRDWDLCSLGAAMANLMIAATALGLGTRWFGNPMLDPAPLQAMLGIPDGVEIVAVTPLGYHDEPAKARPIQPLTALTGFQRGDKYKLAALLQGKLALEDVVHYNRWRDEPQD